MPASSPFSGCVEEGGNIASEDMEEKRYVVTRNFYHDAYRSKDDCVEISAARRRNMAACLGKQSGLLRRTVGKNAGFFVGSL